MEHTTTRSSLGHCSSSKRLRLDGEELEEDGSCCLLLRHVQEKGKRERERDRSSVGLFEVIFKSLNLSFREKNRCSILPLTQVAVDGRRQSLPEAEEALFLNCVKRGVRIGFLQLFGMFNFLRRRSCDKVSYRCQRRCRPCLDWAAAPWPCYCGAHPAPSPPGSAGGP